MKKRKKKQKDQNFRDKLGSAVLQSPPAVLALSVAVIILGIFFIVLQSKNTPISRSDAISYSGFFAKHEDSHNYCAVHFTDGSSYEIYPHTETKEFCDKMKAIPKDTVVNLLVNPNNGYVVEIKTEQEELLNFEASQKAIDSYDNGYIVLGWIMCFCGTFLIVYLVVYSRFIKKENTRHLKKDRKEQSNCAIRSTDYSKKSKILLEATVNEYKIIYRRVKRVNELVVNNNVYDEMKAVLEFEHRLNAVVDNHTIEAGYDGFYSYILFDGKRIAKRKRVI